MSSLEALWGFFAGSKGLIVRSTAGLPQYLAPNPAGPLFPRCSTSLPTAGARQEGQMPEGTQTPRWEPGRAAPALAELPAGNRVHPKCPPGVILQPAVPSSSVRAEGGAADLTQQGKQRREQECCCPCCPHNGCDFFPTHSTWGTVLMMRDLLLSKPRDGSKSTGSSIWPFTAVRRW